MKDALAADDCQFPKLTDNQLEAATQKLRRAKLRLLKVS
jgi:hypothetical protein